jgi:hypothetical protein
MRQNQRRMPSNIPKLLLLFFGAAGLSATFYVQSERIEEKQGTINSLQNADLKNKLSFDSLLIQILRDSARAAKDKPAPMPPITVNVPPSTPMVVYVNPNHWP